MAKAEKRHGNRIIEAISKQGIIGTYWFKDENERAQTVNTEHYVAVLHITQDEAEGLILMKSSSSRTERPPHIKSHP